MQGHIVMPFTSHFIEKTVDLEFYKNWKRKNPDFFQPFPFFLCSFPRSGNGWLRLLLAAILLQSKGVDIEALELVRKKTDKGVNYICFNSGEKEYELEDIFPDIYLMKHQREASISPESVRSLNLSLRLIKTHHIIDCQSSKVIFLFREPMACLTSAALLLNSEEIEKNPEEINATMIYLARYYEQMLEFYLNQKEQYPDRCFFLSHQQASTGDTVRELNRVMDFMGLTITEDDVRCGVKKFPFKSGYSKQYIESIKHSTRELIQKSVEPKYQQVLELSVSSSFDSIINSKKTDV